tara:strand:+ start:122 stop:1192 length:1071 start_codon:yes stop_codon:yes gene_type:complete
MSKFLINRLKSVNPYKVSSHKAWEDLSLDLLKADWNESDELFWPKGFFKENQENLNLNWYPNLHNTKIKQLLANYVNLNSENIYYTNSSDIVQENILKVFIDSGNRVLILTPTYDNFRFSSEVFGAKTFSHKWEDLDLLEKKIELIKPKIQYICNPNNPTGDIMTLDQIEYLVKKYKEIIFIIDEAYWEFSETNSAASLVVENENIIVTRTLSKAFGLAGLRFGYCCAEKNIINDLYNYTSPKQVQTLTQVIVEKVLSNIDYLYTNLSKIKRNYSIIFDELLKNNFISSSSNPNTNFILFKKKGVTSKEIQHFFELKHISIRSLDHIDDLQAYVRLSIPASKKNLNKVLDAIKNFN